MEKEFLKILLKNLNLAGLGADVIDLIVEPALLKVVEKTDTKIDDSIVQLLLPILKPVLKEEIEKLVAQLGAKVEAIE